MTRATKRDLLMRMGEETLKEIAKQEGITEYGDLGYDDLVKKLDLKLKLDEVKKHYDITKIVEGMDKFNKDDRGDLVNAIFFQNQDTLTEFYRILKR